MSNRAQSVEVVNKFFMSHMDEVIKVRDDATSSASQKDWDATTLESHTSLLKDELSSLEQEESTEYNMETVGRKDADANGEVSSLVARLRRDTFD